MPRRIFSNKVLQFTIPGRALCIGATESRFRSENHGESQRLGEKGYIAIARFSAKSAVVEQGWEMVDDEPIYMIVTINVGPGSVMRRLPREKMWRGETLATREPRLSNILQMLMTAFTGVVWKKKAQVVGSLLVKKYTKGSQCVEVLIGRPKNWGELNHDLRNA